MPLWLWWAFKPPIKVYAKTAASLSQEHFRFRNDDGSESAATWVAAEDTNATLDVDTNYRLRFSIEDTASGGENNFGAQFQYNHNSGGWNDVNASSSVVRSSLSSNFAEDDDTTRQLTDPTGGSGTFITPNSGMDEDDGLAGESNDIDFVEGTNDFVEVEYCFQIRSADVADSDTIQLRVVRAPSTVLENYAVTPTATVNEGGGAQTLTGGSAFAPGLTFGTGSVDLTVTGAAAFAPALSFPTGKFAGAWTATVSEFTYFSGDTFAPTLSFPTGNLDQSGGAQTLSGSAAFTPTLSFPTGSVDLTLTGPAAFQPTISFPQGNAANRQTVSGAAAFQPSLSFPQGSVDLTLIGGAAFTPALSFPQGSVDLSVVGGTTFAPTLNFPAGSLSQGDANTFYVSSSGSDSNTGTTPGQAWQTVSKVNGSSFSAGDSILFNRGDVWREQLTPPSDGSSGNPIFFGAYGSGNDPKITGTDTVTTWTQYSTNIYSASFNNGISTFMLLEDDTHLVRKAATGSTLIDDFDGESGTPTGWSIGAKGESIGLIVDSDVLKLGSPFSGFGTLYWDIPYGQNSGVAATIDTPVGDFNEMGMFLGLDTPGSSVNGYELRIYRNSGNDEAYLYRLDSGSRTQIGSTADLGTEIASTDQFRMYRSGDDIVVDFNDGGAGWSNVLTVTDTDHTGYGHIGLSIENNTGKWDDFSTFIEVPPITASGEFYADDTNNTIYARATDDADPDTHTMEIGARYYTVNADDRQYLTFDNLWLHGGGGEFGAGFKCQPQSVVPQNITLQNCRISHSYFAGVWFEHKDSSAALDSLALDTCEVDNNRLRGVFVNAENVSTKFTNVTIDACNVHDNGNTIDGFHGIWLVFCDAPEVTNSTINSNTGSLDWSSGLYVDGSTGAVVTDNTADGNKDNYHFDVNPNGFTCTNNISSNSTNGFWVEEHVDTNGTSTLAHNTSYKDQRGIYFGPGGGAILEVSGVTTKNNIVQEAALSAIGFDNTQGGVISDYYADNDMDYNGYSVQAGGNICETVGTAATYTLSEWQTESSLEGNSLNFDDSLADPANDDFTLATGSIAVDNGVAIAGINDGYLGAAPDLGYLESTELPARGGAAFAPSLSFPQGSLHLTVTGPAAFAPTLSFPTGSVDLTVTGAAAFAPTLSFPQGNLNQGGGGQALAGIAAFQPALTFGAGSVDLAVTGAAAFAPTLSFPTGSVDLTLTGGAAFTPTLSFPAGSVDLTLLGATFAPTLSFPTGALVQAGGAQTLVGGAAFQPGLTFPTGSVDLTVTGAAAFTPTLTFPAGAVLQEQSLSGAAAFQPALTFPTGSIGLTLAGGTVFAPSLSFPAGQVNVTLTGAVFAPSLSFPAGTLLQQQFLVGEAVFAPTLDFPTGVLQSAASGTRQEGGLSLSVQGGEGSASSGEGGITTNSNAGKLTTGAQG